MVNIRLRAPRARAPRAPPARRGESAGQEPSSRARRRAVTAQTAELSRHGFSFSHLSGFHLFLYDTVPVFRRATNMYCRTTPKSEESH